MPFAAPLRRAAVAFLFAMTAGFAAADVATAQFWSSDFNISEGEVNETYTGLNGQRFAVVDDSNNLYVSFWDNRNKVGSDNNFEIYFRKFIYNFGSPSITRVTNTPNPSKYGALATRNWGAGDAATAADSGRIYIAWQDARLYSIPTIGEPKSYNIYFRTFMSRGGEGLGPEIQVSPYDSINAANSPVCVTGDSSRVFVIYQRANNGNTELYYASYNALTRTMGAEQQLTNDPNFSGLASAASTRDGVIHVVWTDNRIFARNQIWWKRFVPGIGWSADSQIVVSAGSATTPSLAATRSGHLHLVWRDNRDGNNEIYYKEYTPAGGWDLVDTRLTINSASQIQPQVDADPMDNAYVVWTDSRVSASDPDIWYIERKAGVWGPETALVYSATDPTNSVQQFPGITHDGIAELYVTWTDERLPASIGKNKDAYYKVGTGFVTAVETSPSPTLARLMKNYPNPFNPRTKINFTLRRDAQALLRVYDVRGRLIRTLVDSFVAAGSRTVEWDGTDDRGTPIASGTYFLRLSAGGDFESRTVTLLK
ncbi:MAG TPA: FlgD immunoglobulin-like domain containing protein [Candidatus Eisenbacteria bacterium]|nr:FlgD immunoglobulin-like domain containing protein [Candidatus Eisenbacteria bacterium]